MGYAKLFSGITERTVSISSSTPESRRRYRTRIWSWLSLIFGGLWLIPAIFVISLNFSNHIVGPSIGCLRSSCRIKLHLTTQIQQTQSLAKKDQDALAGLQLAAKALEAWFCFIAASLVYSILKKLAGRDSQCPLPVGYLHLHTEVGDIGVLRKLFWGRWRDANRMQGRSKARLYFFIIFVAFTCILCNLMGPAAAVLVIPSLEWIPINHAQNSWLTAVMSDQVVLDSATTPNCSMANVTTGNFSCTRFLYSATTDMMAAAAVATDDQIFLLNANQKVRYSSLLLPPILQQGNVSFTVNISDSYVWVPIRQVLRNISTDLVDYDTATTTSQPTSSDYPDSNLFNRSLEARLQQRGPVLGQQNSCYKSNRTVDYLIEPDDDRHVRCYNTLLTNRTKCIPVGTGWKNITQHFSTFLVQDPSPSSRNVTVSIYSTSASWETFPAHFECIMSKNCSWDWNTAFLGPQSPQQTFQYEVGNLNTHNTIIWCDSQTVLALADYSLDPSQLSNTIRLVELDVINNQTSETRTSYQPVFIHPDWTLAAWSADINGTVGPLRGVSYKLTSALQNWILDIALSGSQYWKDVDNIHRFMGYQALSMIPFSTTRTKPKDIVLQPPLYRQALVQVWKYDLNSPSSIFGLVIMMLGIMCVLFRTIFYSMHREEIKDATEILVTAIKHNSSTPLLTQNEEEEEEEDEKEDDDFPLLQVAQVDNGGSPKRIPFKKRISFHG